jgi:hypothetical protein
MHPASPQPEASALPRTPQASPPTGHPRAPPWAWKTTFPNSRSQKWCKHEHLSLYFFIQ